MIFQNAELYNIEALEWNEEKRAWQLQRFPGEVRDGLGERGQKAASYCPGVEVRFQLQGEQAEIVLCREDTPEGISATGIAEVYQGIYPGSYTISPQPVSTNESVVRIVRQSIPAWEGHPQLFAPQLYRVLVPYDWGCYIKEIRGAVIPPAPEQTPSRRLLCYGSSITHGGSATTSSKSYARGLADLLGMDLINMGMAGSAYMEPEMAAFLGRRTDWEIATVELGVNVLDIWTAEEFESKARLFLMTLLEAGTDRPVFCIDIFRNHHDAEGSEKVAAFRQILRHLVEEIHSPRLHYLNGYDMLSREDGLSADGIHPSDRGHQEIAEQLYQRIQKVIE